jgi:protoporphyrinogen IX oxidase
MTISVALRVLHVCANLLWIGSIVAVGLILRAPASPAADRGKIALSVYRGLATPAFMVSFVAGIVMLLLEPAYYFVHTHMMHAKLPLALGVVGLHHWFGARSKRMAAGTATQPSPLPVALLVAGAMGAAVLGLLKPF